MYTELSHAEEIFKRTRNALNEFNEIITPVIENAKDEHERLYWHHIYEEEDHRLDRLNHLIPMLQSYQEKEKSANHSDFVRLLQDVSLEKFGLHNFLEHLDLSLFTFKGTEFEDNIRTLRDMTAEDYDQSKQVLEQLNNEIDGNVEYKASVPTDEKADTEASLKVEEYTSDNEAPETLSENTEKKEKAAPAKRLTVGSLKSETEV